MIRLGYMDYVRSIDPIEKALEHLIEKHEKEKVSLHEKIAWLQAELKDCQSSKEVDNNMEADAAPRARHMHSEEINYTHSMTVMPVTMSKDDDDDDTDMLSAAQEALSRCVFLLLPRFLSSTFSDLWPVAGMWSCGYFLSNDWLIPKQSHASDGCEDSGGRSDEKRKQDFVGEFVLL